MDIGGCGLGERRSAIETAREALRGLGAVLHEAPGSELAELMGVVDDVAAQAGAARVAITVEAMGRGEIEAAGVNVHTWVRDHAPSLRQGGAFQVARVACAVSPTPSRWCPQGQVVDPGSPLGIVWAEVQDGTVSPALACAALREVERLAPIVRDEVLPTVTASMLELGVAWGPTQLRKLRPRLIAEFGRAGKFDDLQARLASAARLSMPVVESGDLTEYQLVMTPEQAAALEAAIGPLSAPAPNDETGERDLRPAGQRRVEALALVCQRSSAADADQRGGVDGAAGSGAALHVSMTVTDLQAGTGFGEVLASTATGAMLSPSVVRRLACSAAVVPQVLGSAGEPLDEGRVERLFTRAQRRVLMGRDRGCTYPGCGAPAAWTQAHHVVHWLDGGATDLDNAALLCQRHHTVVHDRRYVAQVRATPDELGRFVVWDRTVGSYDQYLEAVRAERAVADPRPLTPQRLAELLAAIRADDPDEQHWARLELDLERDEHEQWRQSQDWADLLESMPPRDAEPAQASSCTTTGA